MFDSDRDRLLAELAILAYALDPATLTAVQLAGLVTFLRGLGIERPVADPAPRLRVV